MVIVVVFIMIQVLGANTIMLLLIKIIVLFFSVVYFVALLSFIKYAEINLEMNYCFMKLYLIVHD